MEKVRERLLKKPILGKNVFIASNAVVLGDVVLGDDVSIWYNVVLRGDVENISVGKGSNIQDGSIIHVTKDKFSTIIGEYVTIGHSVTLHGCTINNNVLVGIGAVILDNSVINENCIVAAGAVVPPNKTFPCNTLIMGNPAKPVKELSAQDIEGIRNYADRYIAYKDIYLDLKI